MNIGPNFGVQNKQFGFMISWATNAQISIEACTNVGNNSWAPISTNTLSNGTNYFSDATWTNYPCRFYRIRSP